MFIEKYNNNGIDYLRLSENYRPEGSSRPVRKILCTLGALHKFSDGEPNFLERLRAEFKKGNALIPELQPYVDSLQRNSSDSVETVMLPFPIKGDHQDGSFITKQFSDAILNAYMSELGLSQLFRTLKSKRKIQYDLQGFVKLVVYGRILAPCSKKATVEQNNDYLTPLLKSGFNPSNVYDMLDLVYENQTAIFQTIDKALHKRRDGRDTSVVFYDVTNFFFEIEQNDPDILDNDGVVIEEGMRKRGHSKEGRNQPIVQMGLFMDKEGVPIGIKVFPGNTVDKSTLVKATSEIITPLGYERYIYCADRGLCTLANLAFLVDLGMGYLLSKSIKQSKKEDRDWIIDPKEYQIKQNEKGEVVFKWKHTIVDRKYVDENDKESSFKEKVVVFWSREYYEREQRMMESFSKFLTELETSTKSFTLSSGQIKNILRFLKDEVLNSLNPENDTSSKNTQEGTASTQSSCNDGTGDSLNSNSGSDIDQNANQKHLNSSCAPDSGSTASDTVASNPVVSENPESDSDSQKTESNSKSKRKRLTQEEKDQKAAEKKAEAARLKSLKDSRKKHLNEQLKSSENARKMIDWEKVNRWKDYAGYYQIVTSELEMDDLNVINTYRELTQIENRFRTMKGTMDTRPIFLQLPEHIEGHLVLCTIALILLSLMQCKVKEKENGKGKEQRWYLGMNPDRIQNALNAFQVEPMPQNYVRFRSKTEDQTGKDLQRILTAYGIKIESRLYTHGELRSMRGEIKVFN